MTDIVDENPKATTAGPEYNLADHLERRGLPVIEVVVVAAAPFEDGAVRVTQALHVQVAGWARYTVVERCADGTFRFEPTAYSVAEVEHRLRALLHLEVASILTDGAGRPLQRPTPPGAGATSAQRAGYLRAVADFNDRVADVANRAFADAFARSAARGRRGGKS